MSIFLAGSDGEAYEKGDGTLCEAYLTRHASNHVHLWTCVVFIHQAITKIMLHPESSALIITGALDGLVKVNSLDLMEEIYRLTLTHFSLLSFAFLGRGGVEETVGGRN